MPFEAGNNANPHGATTSSARRALNKIRIAFDKGIDGLGNDLKDGTTVLGEMVTKSLKTDHIRTMKDLSFCLPKDISTEVIHNVAQMTKEQLLEALADCDKVLEDNPREELH